MSFCSNCGAEMTEGTAFCPSCGTAQVQQTDTPEAEVIVAAPAVQQDTAGTLTGPAKILSLISMICGLVSLGSSLGGIFPAIAALILSNLAYKKAPGVPNTKAKVGKITGIIGIVLFVLSWIAYILYIVIWSALMVNVVDSAYYY